MGRVEGWLERIVDLVNTTHLFLDERQGIAGPQAQALAQVAIVIQLQPARHRRLWIHQQAILGRLGEHVEPALPVAQNGPQARARLAVRLGTQEAAACITMLKPQGPLLRQLRREVAVELVKRVFVGNALTLAILPPAGPQVVALRQSHQPVQPRAPVCIMRVGRAVVAEPEFQGQGVSHLQPIAHVGAQRSAPRLLGPAGDARVIPGGVRRWIVGVLRHPILPVKVGVHHAQVVARVKHGAGGTLVRKVLLESRNREVALALDAVVLQRAQGVVLIPLTVRRDRARGRQRAHREVRADERFECRPQVRVAVLIVCRLQCGNGIVKAGCAFDVKAIGVVRVEAVERQRVVGVELVADRAE